MPFYLEKQPTGSTPYILVDEEKGFMTFKGESFHENVVAFFREVSEWLQWFLEKGFPHFTFNCEMTYFNSSTAKLIHNMLMHMDACASPTQPVTVNWITTEDNEIIIECGEDFREDVKNLEFNMIIK